MTTSPLPISNWTLLASGVVWLVSLPLLARGSLWLWFSAQALFGLAVLLALARR